MINKLSAIALILSLIASMFNVQVEYCKDKPLWDLWGNPQNISYDEAAHVWLNNNTKNELWRLGTEHADTERVPVEKRTKVTLRKEWWLKPERFMAHAAVLVGARARLTRRTLLINVEQATDLDEEYKIWPHLGILTIGTVAEEEGWEVVLWDELNQGHVDLERLVRPGDIVGLSLVTSGIDRGVELACKAKELGARFVVAGNDSAIFRAAQLLRLAGKPIDAVVTSNSTNAVRRLYREVTDGGLEQLDIPNVVTQDHLAPHQSNESSVLTAEMAARKGVIDPLDGFVVPNLSLFPNDYWEDVWRRYRSVYGHKHPDSAVVKNALVHLAQGCTRTQGTAACTYCTIYGIGDIRVPSRDYLARVVEAYERFGITTFFGVTDSALEMAPLVTRLHAMGWRPEALTIYGRAQGMARSPRLLDQWVALTRSRLLVNCGMDSGDPRILHTGVVKSSTIRGSMVDENRLAVENVRKSGAHLHFSLIFGSPGETIASCEANMEFLAWVAQTLGPQLDVAETDIYWLNHGSPASRVFHDYAYAVELAALAGKEISREMWHQHFARHANTLSVPEAVEAWWYHHFTSIDLPTALDYVARAKRFMDSHPGRVKMRDFAFKSPTT